MQYAKPPFRPLRAYAFHPASDLDLDQAIGNEVSLMVPWEDQQPGPVGEYVEVVNLRTSSIRKLHKKDSFVSSITNLSLAT